MSTTIGPCSLSILVSIEVSHDKDGALKLTPAMHVSLNGEQVGFISRLRVDAVADEVIPAIEIDMVKGVRLEDMPADVRERVQGVFEALRRVPGVKARMPAPRE